MISCRFSSCRSGLSLAGCPRLFHTGETDAQEWTFALGHSIRGQWQLHPVGSRQLGCYYQSSFTNRGNNDERANRSPRDRRETR
jgi:hypothetical protein